MTGLESCCCVINAHLNLLCSWLLVGLYHKLRIPCVWQSTLPLQGCVAQSWAGFADKEKKDGTRRNLCPAAVTLSIAMCECCQHRAPVASACRSAFSWGRSLCGWAALNHVAGVAFVMYVCFSSVLEVLKTGTYSSSNIWLWCSSSIGVLLETFVFFLNRCGSLLLHSWCLL